jgi:translation initiation factor IF-3
MRPGVYTHRGDDTISRREHRLNNEIRVREVRLIDETGKQLGIYPTREALHVATERGLDLVEVSPDARPPVCRLMDYGKFMYEQSRKEREARKAQKQIEVKEIQVRPKTAEHDVGFKLDAARKFLQEGNKIRVRVRFRGREITHADLAVELMQRVAADLSDLAAVEQTPRMEGRSMIMLLTPTVKAVEQV